MELLEKYVREEKEGEQIREMAVFQGNFLKIPPLLSIVDYFHQSVS